MTVSIAAKTTPESGKVMLTVTPVAADVSHKIYYRVISSDPTTMNVGDTITASEWTEVSGTSAFELGATNGSYIEVVEITSADNKVTKWGKSTATADEYVAPVAAIGMTASIAAKATPESGKVMLIVTPGAADVNHKVYYKVVTTDPTVMNVGDTITTSEWTEVSGMTAFEISATNGTYIEVVEITSADNKVTKWGKSTATDDGYVAPGAATGITVSVIAKAIPESGRVVLAVTGGAITLNSQFHYRVVTTDPTVMNVGDTITTS
jgi:hypothetical protein